MAVITNLSTLETAVADYLARDDLSTFIPNFVQNAENKLYRSLNLRNEETTLNVAISSGVAAVPSDFKALKLAYFDSEPAQLLQWVSLTELYRDYPERSTASLPHVISRQGGNFIFGPSSMNGNLLGVYYAKQDPLRTTDPSWYVTNAPEVLLYGSLLEATPFIMNDERIPVWRAMYEESVAALEIEEDNSNEPAGALIQRAS